MLAAAPFAIPLPARTLVENELGVPDIPARHSAQPLCGRSGCESGRACAERRPAKTGSHRRICANCGQRKSTARNRHFEDPLDQRHGAAPVENGSRENIPCQRPSGPAQGTPRGHQQRTRSEIQMVHPRRAAQPPVSIYIGAAVTLILMIMIPLALICRGAAPGIGRVAGVFLLGPAMAACVSGGAAGGWHRLSDLGPWRKLPDLRPETLRAPLPFEKLPGASCPRAWATFCRCAFTSSCSAGSAAPIAARPSV